METPVSIGGHAVSTSTPLSLLLAFFVARANTTPTSKATCSSTSWGYESHSALSYRVQTHRWKSHNWIVLKKACVSLDDSREALRRVQPKLQRSRFSIFESRAHHNTPLLIPKNFLLRNDGHHWELRARLWLAGLCFYFKSESSATLRKCLQSWSWRVYEYECLFLFRVPNSE
jgi:hypothetical protein